MPHCGVWYVGEYDGSNEVIKASATFLKTEHFYYHFNHMQVFSSSQCKTVVYGNSNKYA